MVNTHAARLSHDALHWPDVYTRSLQGVTSILLDPGNTKYNGNIMVFCVVTENPPVFITVLLGIHQSLLWFCGNPPVFIMVLLGIHQSFGPLPLCFTLWARHGAHSSTFWHWVLFVTFRLVDAARAVGSPEPCVWAAWNPVCGQPGTLCVSPERHSVQKNTPDFVLYTMRKVTPCIMWKITPCIMWKITPCIPAKIAVIHVS